MVSLFNIKPRSQFLITELVTDTLSANEPFDTSKTDLKFLISTFSINKSYALLMFFSKVVNVFCNELPVKIRFVSVKLPLGCISKAVFSEVKINSGFLFLLAETMATGLLIIKLEFNRYLPFLSEITSCACASLSAVISA